MQCACTFTKREAQRYSAPYRASDDYTGRAGLSIGLGAFRASVNGFAVRAPDEIGRYAQHDYAEREQCLQRTVRQLIAESIDNQNNSGDDE